MYLEAHSTPNHSDLKFPLYAADDNDNDNDNATLDTGHHLLRPHPLDHVSTLPLLSIRLQSPTLLLRITNVHYFNVKYTKTPSPHFATTSLQQ